MPARTAYILTGIMRKARADEGEAAGAGAVGEWSFVSVVVELQVGVHRSDSPLMRDTTPSLRSTVHVIVVSLFLRDSHNAQHAGFIATDMSLVEH